MLLLFLPLWLPTLVYAQSLREYQGKLGPELVVNPRGGQIETVQPADAAAIAKLPWSLPAGAKAFYGETFVPTGAPVRFVLVEPAGGVPYLLADTDRDGRWDAKERFDFRPPADPDNCAGDVLFRVPTPASAHATYPIRLSLPKAGKGQLPGKYLLRTPFVYLEGNVSIGGQNTLVWFMYDLKKDAASADWGWQGVDVNGDGQITTGANSEEYTYARDEGVVYRVNGRDVSPRLVSLKERTFVFREHPPGDHTRISLQAGTTVPDFEFHDLQGKPRRLAEFRGKFLLIDFWGSWCAPCRREMPELQSAWTRFRARGLEILGLPNDEDPAQTRAAVQESGAVFTQASPESVKSLLAKRFRINAYPTLLLLDPYSSIVVADSQQLRGEALGKTLDRVLPK